MGYLDLQLPLWPRARVHGSKVKAPGKVRRSRRSRLVAARNRRGAGRWSPPATSTASSAMKPTSRPRCDEPNGVHRPAGSPAAPATPCRCSKLLFELMGGPILRHLLVLSGDVPLIKPEPRLLRLRPQGARRHDHPHRRPARPHRLRPHPARRAALTRSHRDRRAETSPSTSSTRPKSTPASTASLKPALSPSSTRSPPTTPTASSTSPTSPPCSSPMAGYSRRPRALQRRTKSLAPTPSPR